jgi:hypothetical protein
MSTQQTPISQNLNKTRHSITPQVEFGMASHPLEKQSYSKPVMLQNDFDTNLPTLVSDVQCKYQQD